MKQVHRLKTWPEYFQAVKRGDKPFEVRRADRPYAVGDWLILEEWDSRTETYSGDSVTVEVTYLLQGGLFGVAEDYCVMGLRLRL